MRICTACKIEKPFSEFYKLKIGKDGIRPECKLCTKVRNLRKNDCPKCGQFKNYRAKLCKNCVHTDLSFPSIDRYGYKYSTLSGKRVFEHRYEMEKSLNRSLLPGENVHHKNGNRSDNRPSNLELWITSQPKGQRPEDLLEWAYEIIARYEQIKVYNIQ